MKVMGMLLVIFLAMACSRAPKVEKNIYLDPEIQKIHTLQDNRDSAGLITYTQSENPVYLKAAVLGLASIQDPKSLTALEPVLTGAKEDAARWAAAYAIGQLGNKDAENLLIEALGKEKSNRVKRDILEALGKCGTAQGLDFLTSLKVDQKDDMVRTGQARGILRYALRKINTPQGTPKMLELLEQGGNRELSIAASYYLVRVKDRDFKPYLVRLMKIFDSNSYAFVRANLALAMAKVVDDMSQEFVKDIIKTDKDYRVRVNALRAAAAFPYEQMKETVLPLLEEKNHHVAVQAGTYFQGSGVMGDGPLFFESIKKIESREARARMLAAALKFSAPGKEQDSVIAFIEDAYDKCNNPFEQGLLLTALSETPAQWPFVAEKIFASDSPVIKNWGMQSLVTIARHKSFDPAWKEDFAAIFKKAIQSGDVVMMVMAADILTNPAMKYKEIYKEDTAFFKTALEGLKLPEDMEAFRALAAAVKFFNPLENVPQYHRDKYYKPTDWKLITSLPGRAKAVIKTQKGDITLELLVNQAPVAVANFIQLARNGAYKNNPFHRVIPNFVIQAGCPRGDGWGSSTWMIRSDFGPLYYDEGSVGMASMGKDTESSQWFITHCPTAHLDGAYTIFARVISGIDVLHLIEFGDLILDVQI